MSNGDDKQTEPNNQGNKSLLASMASMLPMLIGMAIIWFYFSGGSGSTAVPVGELVKMIEQGRVQKLIFQPETLMITAVIEGDPGAKPRVFNARAVSADHLDEIRKLAEGNETPYITRGPPSDLLGMLFSILPIVIIIWFFLRMQKGGQNSVLGFGKNLSKRFQLPKNSLERITFADVAGCDEAKEEVSEIVEYLKNPTKFNRLGGKIPKGVLLSGLPGTGKTLLAKAIAGESDAPFFFLSGADFIQMFVGVGAARVRDLFEQGNKNAPCIIFIDEIDAIGRSRSESIGGGHEEREGALNAFLTEMDGFSSRNGVIIIAATNRPDILDPALTRPGRFDRQVIVSLPDLQGRYQILKVHTRDKPLDANVDLLRVAKITPGLSGANLANVVNETALLGARRDRKALAQEDFEEMVDKDAMGPARKSKKMSEKEKKITAYHEAGHVLVATLMDDADPIHKVTIIPRGPAAGFAMQLPEERIAYSKKQLLATAAFYLGGRAAEELIFEEFSSGVSNDLKRANDIIKKMIYELSMDEDVGLAVYLQKTDFLGHPIGPDASEQTKKLLEKRVKAMLEVTYDQVKKLLAKNKVALEALAQALLEKETLTGEEVKKIALQETYDKVKQLLIKHKANLEASA